MRSYKKAFICLAACILLLGIWSYKTFEINQKYPKAAVTEHALGDSFSYKGIDITAYKKETVTKAQLEQLYPEETALARDVMEDLGDEFHYLLLYLDLKNSTDEAITHQMVQWVVSYGAFGNGAFLLTQYINEELETLEAGKESKYVLVYNYPAAYGMDLDAFDLLVISQLYPQREYIRLHT